MQTKYSTLRKPSDAKTYLNNMGIGTSKQNKFITNTESERSLILRSPASIHTEVCKQNIEELRAEYGIVCPLPNLVKECLGFTHPVVVLKLRMKSNLFAGSQMKKPNVFWNNFPIKWQVPRTLPNIIGDQEVQIFAILASEVPHSAEITLTGQYKRKNISTVIPFELNECVNTDSDIIHLHQLLKHRDGWDKCHCLQELLLDRKKNSRISIESLPGGNRSDRKSRVKSWCESNFRCHNDVSMSSVKENAPIGLHPPNTTSPVLAVCECIHKAKENVTSVNED